MSSSAPAEAVAERRIVSILFADLVGFTPLSERLATEDVATIQAAYFAAVRETVSRYQGRVEKFIGDAAMAVFGIPRARDDDAERAVRAALALSSAVEQVGARLGLEEPQLRLHAAVNTGDVIVGGTESLATGDAVNVAARLQAAASAGSVLVGETTALAVADAIELQPIEPLALKGKAARVRAWRAIQIRPTRSRDHAMGRLRAPMVGRDDDLRALQRAIAERVGRFVLVAPPGLGKTRLAEEFAGLAGLSVLRARLRPDATAPYAPVAQLATEAMRRAGIAVDADDARAELAARVPGSRRRADVVADAIFAILRPDSASPGPQAADRTALFEAWLEAFEALQGPERTLWVVEDVHWSGGDLLAFLDAASRRDGRMVLATTRPALLERAPDWCRQEGCVRVHELPPLGAVDARTLAQSLTGGALPAALVRELGTRSDGNPLFIEELLRTWIAVGILEDGPDGFRLATDTAEIVLPATVQAIYAAQIDDLPGDAREVARRAAVAGRRFADAALDVLGIRQPESGMSVLERRALLAPGETHPQLGATHVYRHALLRDAGYATLTRGERARLHVNLARWLEQRAGDGGAAVTETIANHYAAAHDAAPQLLPTIDADDAARQAATWFERAARAALELATHEAARALATRALDHTTGATADRARRLELLARATAFGADMDTGAAVMSAALDLYRELADRDGIARAAYWLGRIWLQQLRAQEARELADASLAEIGERNDTATALLLTVRAGATFGITNDLEASERDRRRALRIARDYADEETEFAALEMSAAWMPVQPGQAEEDFDRLVELGPQRGAWAPVAAAHGARALMLMMRDRAGESLTEIAAAEDIAVTHGIGEARAWASYLRCERGLAIGDWDAALADGIRALDLADRNAYVRVAARTWQPMTALADARRDAALLDRLAGWLAPRRPMIAKLASPYSRTTVTAMILVLADHGHGPAPERLGNELAETFAVPYHQPAWFTCADTVFIGMLARHETVAAARALELMEGRNRTWASSMSRGFEHLLRARLTASEADAATALDCFRATRAPWWEAKALRVLGRSSEASTIDQRLGIPDP